jgi:hypothetical protein
MPDEQRLVPSLTLRKWRTWRKSALGWKSAHYMTGFSSAALATVVAVNTKLSFLDGTTALIVASLSAGLSFLVTTMGAQDQSRRLEQAAWELEKAMAVYRTDPSVPESELGKAEARGVDFLRSEKR